MSYCTSCGAQLTGALYCTNCGVLVSGPSAVPGPVPAAAPAGNPAQNPYSAPDTGTTEWLPQQPYSNLPHTPPRRRKRGPLIAALAGAGVVLVIVAALLVPKLLRSSDSAAPPAPSKQTAISQQPTESKQRTDDEQRTSSLSRTPATTAPQNKLRVTTASPTRLPPVQSTVVVTASSPAAQSTVTVVAPPPVTVTVAPTQQQQTKRVFAAPSGNIVCSLAASGVQCVIDEQAWGGNDQPDRSCRYHMLLLGMGSAAKTCGNGDESASARTGTSETSWHQGGVTVEKNGVTMAAVDYGQRISLGNYACSVERTGVICQNTSTGRYFSLARAGYSTG